MYDYVLRNFFIFAAVGFVFCVLAVYFFGVQKTRVPPVSQIAKVPLTIKGIAVLGDSQSDEYRADDARGGEYSQSTLNWVEQLARYRRINVGPWGTRHSPRRTGFEYNWALSGATSSTMLSEGQHTGAAQQVKEGEVNVAIIVIGANDFAPFTQGGYQDIYEGKLHGKALEVKIDGVVDHIETAVTTLQDAGNVHILLIEIPDWEKRLIVTSLFPDPTKRQLVTNAITRTNYKLDALARKHGLATLNPNVFYDQVIGNDDNFVVTLGDVNFDRLTPSNNPHSLFLADNIHPGTVLNGLFANFVIQTLNEKMNTTIEPFTTEQLFSIADIK